MLLLTSILYFNGIYRVYAIYYICIQFIYVYVSLFIFKMDLIIILNTKLTVLKKMSKYV